MLPIGPLRQDYDINDHTNFTQDEQITMVTLWSIFRSPLMIGGEMTRFDDFTMGLITCNDILKMHSNARNSHPVWRRVYNDCEYILWTATAADGGNYIAIFNAGDSDGSIEIDLRDIELYDSVTNVTELWSGTCYNCDGNIINVSVNSHGAKAFIIR